MSRILFKSILIAVILALSMATPAFAIDDPDDLLVVAVYAYEDLLEDGDLAILVDYFIDYSIAGNPTETANEAYLAIFIDTDGTTQLKSNAPYVFQDSGYGRGMVWIYFTAAEVAADSIDRANVALHDIWFMGNPTLDWDADPPIKVVGIDEWDDPAGYYTPTKVGQIVRILADAYELAWTLDLIESTAAGSTLTALGVGYFTNAIPNLRDIAPQVFSASTADPTLEDLDYSTEFGAIVTDGTASVAGDPIMLTEGSQSVNIDGGVPGTIIFTLTSGTIGTVTDAVGSVAGSPVDLVAGINTVSATGAGNVTVDVELVNLQTTRDDAIAGTGFDTTDVATTFGMERSLFTGLVWFIMSICVCAAVYSKSRSGVFGGRGAGGIVMLLFAIMTVGGGVLGLMPIIVTAGVALSVGAVGIWALTYKGANV